MKIQTLRCRLLAFAAGVAILAFSGWAGADPPARVARLGYMSGAVSFSPAGDDDWDHATVNRPLTTGDRLWVDEGARAEIQLGGAVIRMNGGTSVSVLNLDDRIAQLQLTQGTLNVRVRRLQPNQVFEVDTPNLAFTLRQPGAYRIEVDPDGNATTIVVRKGQGEVYGEDAAYVIDARQAYRFTGTGLREYEYVDAPRPDEFDRWSNGRDRSYDDSRSARYVSEDVVGYQDLDEHGSWRVDATYGNVWFPNRVDAGWAPYRDGHWAWIDPWGWTWVDDAPWGFAVSHYGRWANLGGAWCWVPGPVRSRTYYAPALVVFVGGADFQLAISSGNVGGVAWFPLAPREVYRPAYQVSRGYFENINRSNTVINTTVINNTYNNSNVTNVVYANRQVQGAVVAVPTTAFVQSQPVSRTALRVSREMIVGAPLAVVPAVAPTEKSVRGAAQGGKPPPRVFERPVVARTAPPAAPVGFAAQRQQLTAKPGRPLDEAARRELKPVATAPAPVVKVIAQPREAPPTVRPPPAAAGARPGDARGTSDERKARAAPAMTDAPDAPAPGAAPSQAPTPLPAAQPPEQRGKTEPRGNDEQRRQPVAPPPAPPPVEAPRRVAPPQAPPPPVREAQPPEPRDRPARRGDSEAQAPEQRGKTEQRGNDEQRRQPVPAAPPAPPQRAAEPRDVPPQGAPTAQQPARRANPEPAPAARQAEPRPPAASRPLSPPPQALPKAEPRDGQAPRPAAGKPNDKKRDGDEQKREEEDRKQKQ